jgi:sRNA-binding protein
MRGQLVSGTSSRRRLQRGEAILQSFLGHFPGIFAQEAWQEHKPLKIGIHLDIIAAGVVSGTEARLALRAYVNRRQYQAALAAGGTRYDLDGRPSGEVGTVAQEFARKSIARHKHRLSLRAIAKYKAATGMVTKTSAKPEQVQLDATLPSVRRLGLADLKAAARRRKAAIEGTA